MLEDAEALVACRVLLWPVEEARPDLEAVSRALVIACVSAWESYIEELVREAVALLRPASPPLGSWPALQATVRGMLGRFNTPNTDQIRQLFSDALGLADIQLAWTWKGVPSSQVRAKLQEILELRHRIAHGVNPRPTIDPAVAGNMPHFFN